MRKGVIYARYSCEKQTDNSIKGQVRECTLFAERNDIQIINVYSDEAISGRTDRRPAFLRMFRDAAQHQFDVIIVWKGDRFSRNRADAAKYKNELKKLNIQLLSATEANVTGPEAILMDGINEAFAEFYSVELAEKVNRGMLQNLLDGKYIGGPLILGYKVEDHRVVIDEEKAELVKKMFDMFATTELSVNALCDKLNSLGYTNNGKPFKRSTVGYLLTNRKYLGEFEYKGQVHLNCYPAIIDEALFEKVQRKLQGNRKQPGHYRNRENYLLTGKLYCGECGEQMKSYGGISSVTHKYFRYYKCGGTSKHGCQKIRFEKGPLEKAVIELLIGYISHEMNVDLVVEEIMASFNKINPELKRLEEALESTEQAIKNYRYALEKGLNLDDTIERLKELTANKRAYEEEIRRLKIREKLIEPKLIKSYLEQMAKRDYTKAENINYLINVLVYKIILYKDDTIRIILNTVADGNPEELEATVQLLASSDHHLAEILNCLNIPDEFSCLWMEVPIVRKSHKGKRRLKV